MSEKPILFNTAMVRAILDGRKTVTRRVIKPQPEPGWECFGWCTEGEEKGKVGFGFDQMVKMFVKPRYAVGDTLWVRETWCSFKGLLPKFGKYFYRSDGEGIEIPTTTGGTLTLDKADGLKWRPSIHMPRAAARIFLEVTDVKVEQLQRIDADEARAEGMFEPCIASETGYETEMLGQFRDMWDSTIKKNDLSLYGWESNPWILVYQFRRIEK